MAGTVPLIKARVLYLGSSIPLQTSKGINAVQAPLLQKLGGEYSSYKVSGVDSTLTVYSGGMMLEPANGTASSWFPIQSLHLCCSVTKMGNAFVPISGPMPPNEPPIFTAITRRTHGVKVLECHVFLCRKVEVCLALTQSCMHAYNHREGWAEVQPSFNILRQTGMRLMPAEVMYGVSSQPITVVKKKKSKENYTQQVVVIPPAEPQVHLINQPAPQQVVVQNPPYQPPNIYIEQPPNITINEAPNVIYPQTPNQQYITYNEFAQQPIGPPDTTTYNVVVPGGDGYNVVAPESYGIMAPEVYGEVAVPSGYFSNWNPSYSEPIFYVPESPVAPPATNIYVLPQEKEKKKRKKKKEKATYYIMKKDNYELEEDDDEDYDEDYYDDENNFVTVADYEPNFQGYRIKREDFNEDEEEEEEDDDDYDREGYDGYGGYTPQYFDGRGFRDYPQEYLDYYRGYI